MSAENSALAEWRRYWTLPLAAALGYTTAVLHVYSIGPFMAPIAQEFGFSRAQMSAGITIVGLVAAAMSVPIGLLVDKVGPRRVGLLGVVLSTMAFASLGTATGGIANWIFLWCLMAGAVLFTQATVWTSAVASRFETSRGLAFAITLSGASVASTVCPILAVWLIDAYNWRVGFFGLAAIWLAFVLPMMLLFFRGAQDTAGETGPAAAGNKGAPGVSVAEGLHTTAFWKLLIACGLFTFTVLGIMVHFVPMLTDGGSGRLVAASIASLIGIFSIVGRLGTGFLLDRLPSHLVGGAVFLIPILACAILLTDTPNTLVLSVAAACLGLTIGAEVDVIAYLTSRHFGLKNYGVLFGSMVGALCLGTAFGPLAAGVIFDVTGGYQQFLYLTIGAMLISGAALVTLGRPRYAASGQAAADAA